MTHFTVAVIVPKDVFDAETYIAGQMKPYEEHSEAGAIRLLLPRPSRRRPCRQHSPA